MTKIISRDLYLKKLEPYSGKPVIKVFTGQRRVGKSFMMLQVMDQIRRDDPECNLIYIDKEKHEFDFISDYRQLADYISKISIKGRNAVFIDEIQEIDQFEKAIRSFYNRPGFEIYCTGSNAKILSGELASHLSGRYVELEVHSLSYREFLDFHNLAPGNESINIYLKIGGLPNLIHLRLEDDIVFDYLKNIYASILFRDVIKRHNVRNVSFLENLVLFLSDNTGSIFSAKRISDFLKYQKIMISPNVVLDYLSHLTASFFVHKVRRFEVTGKKIFKTGEKYYFEDIGLRNSITGFRPTDVWKNMENAVFSHLRIMGYNVYVGVSGKKEISFVAEKKGERIYIQVCYLLQDQTTIDREFGNLLAVKDNYPKIVVSMDELFGKNTYLGIRHMHLREFLMEIE